jgi:hypothetical protein
MTADIEVLDLRPVENFGNVRGFVSVRVDDVTIVGAKIVQQPGHAPGSQCRIASGSDEGGAKHWSPVIKLSNPLKRRVDEAVLAAWGNG